MDTLQAEHPILAAIGGAPGLARAVDLLYARVMEDELLQVYFHGSDVDRIKHGQVALLAGLLGTPEGARPPSIRGPHKGLLATDQAFDLFVKFMCESLAAVGAAEADLPAFKRRLDVFRPDVVDDFEPNPAYNYARKA